MLNKIYICTLLLLLTVSTFAQKNVVQSEKDFYALKTVAIPDNVKLEVGGIAVMPDGRIAASTRRGEIWIIQNAYGNGQPHFTRFASGLHEVLGLAYRDGAFYCTQRGELTKIEDKNNDGIADSYTPITLFELSGNYHEYAYGPVFDKNGDMYVTLNVAWVGYGDGLGKWHGWLIKVKPDGTQEPIATGLRSPAGFNVNSNNDVFYAENQGDWVGSGRVTHLEKGDFAGNAGGLNWTKEPNSPLKLTKEDLKEVDNGQPMHEAAKKIKELKLPAVWFPHSAMGISTADIIEDQTNGAFGPFGGQYFVADQGHSKIMRMSLEKVNGKYQGACYPFYEGFASGLVRLRWGLDGSMFGGMTSRGWASTGKAEYALQRLVWNGELPFEMKDIHAMSDGFEVEFTAPVNSSKLKDPKNFTVNSFTYKYQHQYGSPIINNRTRKIIGMIPSADGRKVKLVLDSLIPGYIHEIRVANLESTEQKSLLHDFAYYTLNEIPAGEKTVLTEGEKVNAHAGMHHDIKKTAPTKTIVSKKRQTTMPADWTQPEKILKLGTKPGLKYDVSNFEVKAGSKVRLIFNNNDDMTHNVVITAPGAADEVGSLALKMGLKGSEMNYVPSSNKVLFHTGLLQPETSESIYFVAPSTPGEYMFVCTFPGHAAVMRGIIKVVP
ncbi:MAG: plastocyanin/azurin family copper-binding protein [Chitinophagaceae bacterium]|nr:plastocyanin/azurin family copper-binding protein [Chitinophagaceae bacterium]